MLGYKCSAEGIHFKVEELSILIAIVYGTSRMSLVTRIVTTHPFGYFKSILNILLRFTSLHPRTNTLAKPGVWVWVRHIDYRMKVFLEEDTSIDYFTA